MNNQSPLHLKLMSENGSPPLVARRHSFIICSCGLLVAAATMVSLAGAADVALALRNPGMEEGTSTPTGWQPGPPVTGVHVLWDHQTAHSGKASLCLLKTVPRYFPIAQWSQSLSVEPSSAPRKLRVQCWVKADNVTKAIIDVNYQGDGLQAGHVWAVYLGQKQKTDPVLTQDWKLCEGVVEVPAKASKIGIAFQIYGPGAVWFDDLQVGWGPG